MTGCRVLLWRPTERHPYGGGVARLVAKQAECILNRVGTVTVSPSEGPRQALFPRDAEKNPLWTRTVLSGSSAPFSGALSCFPGPRQEEVMKLRSTVSLAACFAALTLTAACGTS